MRMEQNQKRLVGVLEAKQTACFLEVKSSIDDRVNKMSAGKWPLDLAAWESRLVLRRGG